MNAVVSTFSRVAGPSMVYLGTNVIRAALPFLLIPFLTQYLSPAQYGIAVLYQTLIVFLVPFVPFNVASAVTIEYYKRSREEFAVYVTSSCIPPILISLVLTAAFLIIPSVWIGSSIPRRWLVLSPLFGLSQLLPNLLLAVYQVQQKAIRFGLFTIGMSALNVALTLLFIQRFQWGWQGRLDAIIWSQIVFSALAFVALRRSAFLSNRISWKNVAEVSHFCAPLIPHSIGGTTTDIGDRLIIAAQMNSADLGRYTVAAQIGQTLAVFVSSLNQAWAPFLFRELTDITQQRKREIVATTYAVAGVILLAFGGLVIFAPMAAHTFVDRRYWTSLHLVPWFGLGYVFNGFYFLIANYIFFAKQTRVLAMLTFGNAIVSVGLTWFGVRQFGMQGAAWASALSWGIFFVAAWMLSQKVLPMPWVLGKASIEVSVRTDTAA